MADDMLPKDVGDLKPLHTLQTDLAEVSSKISTVSIITDQVKAKEIEIKEKEAEKKEEAASIVPTPPVSYSRLIRNSSITLASVLVIGASAYGIFYTAKERSVEAPVVVVPAAEDSRIIIYDIRKDISISSEELSNKEALASKLRREVKVDSVGTTFFDTGTSFKNLLFSLSPSIPSSYQRSLASEDFFGGLQSGNFFIFKVDSYEQAYSGQLEWESSMKEDLFPLFGISSSSTLVRFDDRVVSNRDVRAAIDEKGNVLFIHGFYRINMIIFAKNEETYRQVYEMLLRRDI